MEELGPEKFTMDLTYETPKKFLKAATSRTETVVFQNLCKPDTTDP